MMVHSPYDYCLRQILKIGHYLSQIKFQELLYGDFDFYRDENGKIWLCDVRNILVRPRRKNEIEMLAEEKTKAAIRKEKFQKAFKDKLFGFIKTTGTVVNKSQVQDNHQKYEKEQ